MNREKKLELRKLLTQFFAIHFPRSVELCIPFTVPMSTNRLKQLFIRTVRLSAAAIIPAAMVGEVGLGVARADSNPFAICAAELREAEVTETEALGACAEALEPADLSWCVLRLYNSTSVDGTSALRSCFRARRPVELATCAIDITRAFREQPSSGVEDGETIALAALDSCRRSLIPGRFADCAVGLNRQTDFSQTNILNACIAAEAFPPTLFPRGGS